MLLTIVTRVCVLYVAECILPWDKLYSRALINTTVLLGTMVVSEHTVQILAMCCLRIAQRAHGLSEYVWILTAAIWLVVSTDVMDVARFGMHMAFVSFVLLQWWECLPDVDLDMAIVLLPYVTALYIPLRIVACACLVTACLYPLQVFTWHLPLRAFTALYMGGMSSALIVYLCRVYSTYYDALSSPFRSPRDRMLKRMLWIKLFVNVGMLHILRKQPPINILAHAYDLLMMIPSGMLHYYGDAHSPLYHIYQQGHVCALIGKIALQTAVFASHRDYVHALASMAFALFTVWMAHRKDHVLRHVRAYTAVSYIADVVYVSAKNLNVV